jgi:hypothetical protein
MLVRAQAVQAHGAHAGRGGTLKYLGRRQTDSPVLTLW